MQSRWLAFLMMGVLAAGCRGTDEQAEAPAAAATAPEMSADEAAVDQIRADYVTHYNMGHPEVVADLYADSAFLLQADGSVYTGKAEILTRLQSDAAAGSTLTLTAGETMVLGDNAVTHGTWSRTFPAAEGAEPRAPLAGHYLTFDTKQGEAWKLSAVITNFEAPPPADLPMPDNGDPPPDEGTMTALIDAYEAAFNAGDAAAVAAMYTDNGFHAFANLPVSQGPAGIQATLAERFAAGQPTIEIHDVGTIELGEGWAIDGGWYSMTAPAEGGTATQTGTYMNLLRQQADGSWKIHWGVSNGRVQM